MMKPSAVVGFIGTWPGKKLLSDEMSSSHPTRTRAPIDATKMLLREERKRSEAARRDSRAVWGSAAISGFTGSFTSRRLARRRRDAGARLAPASGRERGGTAW